VSVRERICYAGALALGVLSTAVLAAPGRTEGEQSVSPAGEATYTIPIFAPPGAKGLAPKLALTYGHRSPGVLFGEGWNLSGQSEISVCPKTWAQDTQSRAVRLDGTDRFCLDGEQLKLDIGSSAYGSNGAIYRTEIESFARVKSVGVVGNTPDCFVVERKDGLTYYYGASANSRIESMGSTTAHTWALSAVVDRSGNRMEFSYFEDATNGSYQLTTVSYASNPGLGVLATYAISLTYATQPVPEIESGYLAGGIVRDVKRATQIDVTHNSTLVRRYTLAYEGTLSSAGNSRLASVTECGGSAGNDCLSPLTFTYQDGTPGLNAVAAQSFSTPAPTGAMALDVNGDGKTDLVYPSSATSGGGTWMVAFANGTGGFGTPVNSGISNVNYARAVPIDYNADGLEDFLVPYSGSTWWVVLGTTSGLASPVNTSADSTWSTAGNAKALDINGDGLEDLVEADWSSVWYWKRNLAGTFDTWQYVIQPLQGLQVGLPLFPDRGMKRRTRAPDFNGDGQGDFAINFVYTDINTNITTYFAELKLGGTNDSVYVYNANLGDPIYADLNGDRYTDIVYNTGVWTYWLGTGAGVAGPFSGPSTAGQDTLRTVALDWDGNGTEDLVAPHADGYWRVMRSTGAGFGTIENPGLYFGNVGETFVGDTNGDSLDDLIYANAAGVFGVSTHLGMKPDLLRTVMDGYNNVITFDYTTLTHNGHYAKGASAVFPYMDYQGPLSVVARVTLPDGNLSTYTITYQYWYAQVHRQGRGFAGFNAILPYDSRSGIWDFRYYMQSFPYTGLEYTRNVYQPDWTQITHDATGLTYHAYSGGTELRYFPYANSTLQRAREVAGPFNGAVLREVNSTIVVDAASGTPINTTAITTEGAGANGLSPGKTWTQQTTITSLLNDTTNWCLGKAQTVQQAQSHSGYGGGTQTRTVGTTWNGALCRPTHTYVEPGNGTWQITTALGYDGFGNVNSESVTGAGMTARTRTTDYGATGQFPVSVTNALNQTATQAWNYGLGVPSSQTDPNGVSLVYLYDNFGRRIRETRPDGTYTNTDWAQCPPGSCDPRIFLYRVDTDYAVGGTALAQRVMYFDREDRSIYDMQWVPLNGAYRAVTRTFDSRGRMSVESTPHLSTGIPYWTTHVYDLLDRETHTWRQISETNSGSQVEVSYYEGLTVRQVDAESHERRTVSDAIGKTVKASDPNNYATLFDFDAFGQPIRVMDSSGATLQTNSYNLRGYRTASTDVDMGNWTYGLNALGEVTSQTDAKSQVTMFDYDELGRLYRRVEPDGTGTITNWFVYGTNPALKEIGKLKYQQVYGTNVTGYYEWHYYDPLGRLIQTQYNDSTTNYYVDQSYNATTGLLDAVEYPTSYSGSTPQRLKVKYEYGGSDLIRVKDFYGSTVFWQANAFDARMNVADESLGNGLRTVRAVDAITGLLASIQTGPGGGSAMQNLTYQWDKVGNLKERKDVNQSKTEAFTYDALDRLTQSTLNGVVNLDVSYQLNGNIQSKADQGATAYTYAYHPTKIHAVASTTNGLSFAYDANGNITSRTGSSVTWYANNKPKTINNGSDSSTFEYGPSGQYWRQYAVYGTGPETTTYIGGLWEKVVGSTVTAYRNYVKAGGRNVAIWTYRSTGVNDGYFPLSDHLGSTESVTNFSGALIVKESFDAFGKRRGSNWTGVPTTAESIAIANTTRRGFTGHTMLDNVGLVHMNGRVYDPMIGRFLSADPNIDGVLDTQGWNRYSYVKNNPLSYTDPTGYLSFKKFFKKWLRPVLALAVAVYMPQAIGAIAGKSAAAWAATAGFNPMVASSIASAAASSSLATAVATGAVAGAVATGSLRGALQGALSAGLFYGAGSIGDAFQGTRALAHAGAGCLSSVASGGQCSSGALSGGVAELAGSALPGSDSPLVGGLRNGLIGGISSAAGGGQFSDGFNNGVFGFAFNFCMHNGCFDRAFTLADAMEQWRNGRGQPVTGVNASDLNLRLSEWTQVDKNPSRWAIRLSLAWHSGLIYGTVTGVEDAQGRVRILRDRYNFDQKPWITGSLRGDSSRAFRNVATGAASAMHGRGQAFDIHFVGSVERPKD
jgi:RHS repeat-associated protein